MIYITVGVTRGFDRLLKSVDSIANENNGKFIFQTGHSDYSPVNGDRFKFADPDAHKRYISHSEVVIGHAGTGTLLTCMAMQSKLIVFPRDPNFDEVSDNHQIHHVEGWSKSIDINVANNKDDLLKFIEKIENIEPLQMNSDNRLVKGLNDIIEDMM